MYSNKKPTSPENTEQNLQELLNLKIGLIKGLKKPNQN